MKQDGMVNVGQLVREKWGASATISVGFGSYKGSVIAGSSWGAPFQVMQFPGARPDSWEEMLHHAEPKDKILLTGDIKDNQKFRGYINHRAIGVVYNPENEKYGNYVPTILPERYDAFVFIDETRALHPVETRKDPHLIPETYPFGI